MGFNGDLVRFNGDFMGLTGFDVQSLCWLMMSSGIILFYQSVYGKICRHMDRAYPYGMMLAKATGEIVGGCPQFHAISCNFNGKRVPFFAPMEFSSFPQNRLSIQLGLF